MIWSWYGEFKIQIERWTGGESLIFSVSFKENQQNMKTPVEIQTVQNNYKTRMLSDFKFNSLQVSPALRLVMYLIMW